MNIYKIISNDIKSKIKEVSEIKDIIPSEILNNIVVEVPKNRDFGDFSTNISMALARPLGKSPRDIANIIIPYIQQIKTVESVSIAGPGFINIKLKNEFIVEAATHDIEYIHNENPLQIDLDYGGYNIGKNLHIGHLRTTVVGDTFNRIAKYLGHKTKSYNHMGDWGRPMGLILAWIIENGEMPKSADDINYIYPASTSRAKEDSDWMERAKKSTVDLQTGDKLHREIYDITAPMSLGQIDAVLKRLNVLLFDENKGERLIAEYVPEMDKVLREKGLLVLSDGAEIVPVKQDTDTAPMPPVMWRSSAGAQTYAAADLTAVYYRVKTDRPNNIIYFTDSRQNLHFTQIFRAANLAEVSKGVELQHIGFGTITGPDGKPFKTRDGDVPSLDKMFDIVGESVRICAKESNKELSNEAVEMIALAALKFNDLMHDVKSDYIFDVDAVTKFEGRTGPYVLYTAVRLNSVIKRADKIIDKVDLNIELHNDERNLLLILLEFERVLDFAFARRAPDILANYTYDLCQSINTFYHNCPILRGDVEQDIKAHRLLIVNSSLKVLLKAIDLMGLRVPESM